MKIQEFLIPQLKQEVALTEKFLSRIPEDKLEWRPHEKSMTMGQLANHIAEIPGWIPATMETGFMDMGTYQPPNSGKVMDIVSTLKKNAGEAERSLQKPDEKFSETWAMKKNGETLMEMPKYNVLTSMVMPQLPHHRAQLGVYFRMLNVPVPSSYGPSADEN